MTALAAAGIGTACRALPGAGPGGPSSLDDVAERYVRVTLQLAQHQPSLVEAWRGPDSWRPGPRRPVAVIRTGIEQLRTDAAADQRQGDRARQTYLRQQIDGLWVAARRLSGETMRVSDEAGAALGGEVAACIEQMSPANAAGAARIAHARQRLEQQLPGGEGLHHRYRVFRARHALAPGHLTKALAAARDACQRRVLERIPLPEGEAVELEPATGFGLEGAATYEGQLRTRVRIDLSGTLDVARLLWVVAHETYPGHHVQHVLAERATVGTRHWQERALWPVFGRHLLCAEGAAEAGAALLFDGPAFEDACREVAEAVDLPSTDVAQLVGVHRAVAELDGVMVATARAYLDGQIGSDAAAEQLEHEGLVIDPQRLLGVIERQRTRFLVYPVGRRLVWSAINAGPVTDRWTRLSNIATLLVLPPSAGG